MQKSSNENKYAVFYKIGGLEIKCIYSLLPDFSLS